MLQSILLNGKVCNQTQQAYKSTSCSVYDKTSQEFTMDELKDLVWIDITLCVWPLQNRAFDILYNQIFINLDKNNNSQDRCMFHDSSMMYHRTSVTKNHLLQRFEIFVPYHKEWETWVLKDRPKGKRQEEDKEKTSLTGLNRNCRGNSGTECHIEALRDRVGCRYMVANVCIRLWNEWINDTLSHVSPNPVHRFRCIRPKCFILSIAFFQRVECVEWTKLPLCSF